MRGDVRRDVPEDQLQVHAKAPRRPCGSQTLILHQCPSNQTASTLLAHVKQLRPGQPIIMATASAHKIDADGKLSVNVDHVLFTFNLLSLYQQTATPKAGYRQPATLRATLFLCGAILGRTGRQAVLHLSSAWGGLDKLKPLLEAIFHWPELTPPKLDSTAKPSAFTG